MRLFSPGIFIDSQAKRMSLGKMLYQNHFTSFFSNIQKNGGYKIIVINGAIFDKISPR